MGFRVTVGTVGGILIGVPLALFLANWAGAPVYDQRPSPLLMALVQAGYVLFLLSPFILIVALFAWFTRRRSAAEKRDRERVSRMAQDALQLTGGDHIQAAARLRRQAQQALQAGAVALSQSAGSERAAQCAETALCHMRAAVTLDRHQ
ncbi:MAG: hypothetical protein OXG13_08420 [Gemmatimonadaceae bacterium]|nr:hypothetical protein [Gemmatimonadaceae bacterium]